MFLPLTFSWAIVRYRLMDVDLIFKRGVTYTLATAALVGALLRRGGIRRERSFTRAARPSGVLGPDRGHHRDRRSLRSAQAMIQDAWIACSTSKRFDYRETLIEFGREPELADGSAARCWTRLWSGCRRRCW